MFKSSKLIDLKQRITVVTLSLTLAKHLLQLWRELEIVKNCI